MRRAIALVLCCLAPLAAAPGPAAAATARCTPSAELRERVKVRLLATPAGRERAKQIARARRRAAARTPKRPCGGRHRPAPSSTVAPSAPGTPGAPGTPPAASPASGPPAGGGGAPPPPPPPAAAPVRSTVGADAYDFGTFVLRLTRQSVPAGELTIYFRNNDISAHNLWLDPPQAGAADIEISAAVGEGEGATKTVTVTPGTWRLYCSLSGHDAMTRDLAVQ